MRFPPLLTPRWLMAWRPGLGLNPVPKGGFNHLPKGGPNQVPKGGPNLRLLLGVGLSLAIGLCLLIPPAAPPAAEAALFHFAGPVPAELGVKGGHLAACATPAHCARETWPATDPEATLTRLLPAVLALEGVELVSTEPGYLHATATSRLFGFVDDLELHADAAAGVIEARSTSRLGDSDLGVNARRLASLKAALRQLEAPAGAGLKP